MDFQIPLPDFCAWQRPVFTVSSGAGHSLPQWCHPSTIPTLDTMRRDRAAVGHLQHSQGDKVVVSLSPVPTAIPVTFARKHCSRGDLSI